MTARSGFTVIELVVALAVAGLVALAAHRTFAAVAGAAARVHAAREALDRSANARRLLAELAGSLDVGEDAGGFLGQPARLDFSAWTRTGRGWLTRRRVTLEAEGDALVARGLEPGAIALAGGVASVEFDYLLEPGAAEHWVRRWISPVSAPVAIRLRVTYASEGAGADTLLLVVGERG